MENKTRSYKNYIIPIIVTLALFSTAVVATTIITDTGIDTPAIVSNLSFTQRYISLSTNDARLTFNGWNSLLEGTPSSEGIYFNQTRPEAKGGIYWRAYDAATNKNQVVGWFVCHYNSSNNPDAHSHCAFETFDNSTGTPSINSHFTITYNGSQTQAKVGFPSAYVSNMQVDDIFSVDGGSIDFKADTNVRVFSGGQTTVSLNINNNTNGMTINAGGTNNITFTDDNVTITQLAGSGEAFACLDANGMLYRKATACAA